jgi:predicted DNA-binding transcriptional regulator YafY
VAKGTVVTRWFKIFHAIQAKHGITATELAERTGVSKRQIDRDLEQMPEAGFPIYNDEATKTWRMLEGWQMRPLQLTPEEVHALVLSLGFAKRALPAERVTALTDKLLASLSDQRRAEASALKSALAVEPAGARSQEDEAVVRTLEEAITGRKRVQLRYINLSKGGSEELRTVRPYGVVLQDGARYLIAHCDQRDAVRHFRISRITAVRVLPKGFHLPADWNLERYLTQHFGITSGDLAEIRLRFRPEVARLAQETQFHTSQVTELQADGSALLTMQVLGLVEVSRWVVQYGGAIEVLAPEALKEKVCEIARGALEAMGS